MGQNEQEQAAEPSQRAVVYVRISDDPEGGECGVDRQEADCRAYAAAHGWEITAVFRENDTSAFKQRTITLPSGERVRRVIRPQFRAMLTHLADGQAQVMIAYDLDRAVRDPRDLEDLIDAKVLAGFTVRSVTGSLRLDTDSDVAMASQMQVQAVWPAVVDEDTWQQVMDVLDARKQARKGLMQERVKLSPTPASAP
ncbi:recombinase family protein [Nesterenkonia ebinurensis]|uniref:recombinase family protein n=1 Tax=Nesterenkonia ebinurensis TaxID=2608252 RepID=UPI001CC75791|nr:recombinase family protein [Nesterenkonia ebinurensis]